MDLSHKRAENLRAWLLSTLFHPQKYFEAVKKASLGRLIDTDFNEIDLSDPIIVSLGQFLGHDKLPGEMTLNTLFESLRVACHPKFTPSAQQIGALEAMISRLEATKKRDASAWKELERLWKFISVEYLPNFYMLDECPIFDINCSLDVLPRYRLEITCFQYTGDYDDETGEDVCYISTMNDSFHTDSLDAAVAQIEPACRRAIEHMIKSQWSETGFLKWAQVFEGQKMVLSIQYNVPNSCRETNAMGLDGYSMKFSELHTSDQSKPVMSALKKAFGQSLIDRISENNFARDLGL